MPDITGEVLLRNYKIIELIGRGGMAEVYKVWDENRATHLALKLLRDDLAQDRLFLRRFKREAQTLSTLQHPNIVRFYDLEQDGLLAFLLMDFVEGSSLRAEIFQLDGKPMQIMRVLEIISPICSALHFAHRQGIVHCDVKPGNILIEESGRVLVTDFGIARMTDAATATMVGIGTPAYLAPDQIHGFDPTPQTDIYSLGVILFEMLTGGERPFTGEQATITGSTSEKVRWEQMKLEPPSLKKWNPDVLPELEALVLRCLDKEPLNRFESVLVFLDALEQASGARTSPPQPAFMLVESSLNSESKLAAVVESADVQGPMQDIEKAPSTPEPEVAAADSAMHKEGKTIPKRSGKRPKPVQKPTVKSRKQLWIGLGAAIAVVAAAIVGYIFIINPPSDELVIPGFAHVVDSTGVLLSKIPGEEYNDIDIGELLPPGAGSMLRTTDGISRLILPDGSEIFLGQETEIELTSLADPSMGTTDTSIFLVDGQLLSVVDLLEGNTFVVEVETGAWASVVGSIMGVEYDPSTQLFHMDCLEGHCIQGASGVEVNAIGGQHLWQNADGEPQGPDISRNDIWIELFGEIVPSAPEVTGEPDAEPTATLLPTKDVPTRTPAATFTPTPTDTPEPICYTLSLVASPSKGGSIAASPSPNCGNDEYLEGTTVTLTASTATEYLFDGWSQDASGSLNPTTVTMSRDKTVTALFTVEPANIVCYDLTTNVSPGGSGDVNVSPSPNCTGGKYKAGTTVTLTASENSGFSFSHWTGDGSGSSNPVGLTINGNKNITANFDACYSLSTSVSPGGSGTIGISPAPNCGSNYVNGTSVTLTANVNSGYGFSHWTGSASGSSNPVVISMNSAKSVTANFDACYSLSTSVSPGGSGTIGISPAPNCGSNYVNGTSVTLTANANSGYGFSHWTGSASGSSNPVVISMNSAKSVTANFDACYSLSTDVSPGGSGTIGISPAPNCGSNYVNGTSVTLTAGPNSGYGFSHWTGSASGSSNPVVISMNSAKSVTANFDACVTVTTAVSPGGSGSVGVNPSPNCSGGLYLPGTSITLTCNPSSGYQFDHWGGGVSSTSCPIVISPSSNVSVTAYFTLVTCYDLNTSINPSGFGSISKSSSPNCPWDGNKYTSGTGVTLTANPSSGKVFTNWTGDASGSTNPISVTMNGNKNITANFISCYTLSISISGSGSVSTSPGQTCTGGWQDGTSVTMTPSPSSGWLFDHWGGDADCNDGVVLMNQNHSCTAYFVQVPPPPVPDPASISHQGCNGSYHILRGSWANVANENGYRLLWHASPSETSEPTVGANTTTHTINNLFTNAHSLARLYVRAYNAGGESSAAYAQLDISGYSCP